MIGLITNIISVVKSGFDVGKSAFDFFSGIKKTKKTETILNNITNNISYHKLADNIYYCPNEQPILSITQNNQNSVSDLRLVRQQLEPLQKIIGDTIFAGGYLPVPQKFNQALLNHSNIPLLIDVKPIYQVVIPNNQDLIPFLFELNNNKMIGWQTKGFLPMFDLQYNENNKIWQLNDKLLNYSKIFEEYFLDNRNNWWIGYASNTFTDHKIANNQYIINQNGSGGIVTSINLPIGFTFLNDFIIELSVNFVSGAINHGYGFLWGGAKNTYYTFFYISSNGYFQISKRENNNSITICPWQFHNSIIQGYNSSNILKIEKNGNQIDFYINNQFVYYLNYCPNVFGNQFGLAADSNISFATNFVKIYEK